MPNSGGITTYFHGGEEGKANRRMPFRFFVPNNSGTPRVIRIAFAPFAQNQDIRLDGVSVKKSLPDLVSMSNVQTYGNYFNESPYNGGTENWDKYQMTFKIPARYNNASDWVINFNAGSLGEAMIEGRISQGVVIGDKFGRETPVMGIGGNYQNNFYIDPLTLESNSNADSYLSLIHI